MSERQQDPRATSVDVAALRKLAEERAETMEQTFLSAHTPEEIQRMLHELQVHQIELEMQNEELRTAQAQIEAGRVRYVDVYDQFNAYTAKPIIAKEFFRVIQEVCYGK